MMRTSHQVPESLVREGNQLLAYNRDQIVDMLGLQLLAGREPRVALSIAQSLSISAFLGEPRRRAELLPSEGLLPESLSALGDILREGKEAANAFIRDSSPLLRKALCTGSGECQPNVAEVVDRGSEVLQVLIPLVANALSIPPTLPSIAVTFSVLLVKTGLRQFCRGSNP
jgi:hypothetical protein